MRATRANWAQIWTRQALQDPDHHDTPGADLGGLNMMAGVITSIPYDSVMADGKSPIPVEYLPRPDQMPVRREPLPHHLNKPGTDYHQYPSFDPATLPNGSSHPSGPRPPPGVGNVTMASTGDRRTQLQQWGPGRASNASTLNGHNSRYDSYSTAQTSAYGRNSFDHSSADSSTDRSSVFSSGSSSRTAMPASQSTSSFNSNLSPSHASVAKLTASPSFLRITCPDLRPVRLAGRASTSASRRMTG